MSGPHHSPIYFAWINSNNSIIWNYGIWFLNYLLQNILKITKNVKNMTRQERKNGGKNLWKSGFLEPKKNAKDEKWGVEIIWEIKIWKSYL